MALLTRATKRGGHRLSAQPGASGRGIVGRRAGGAAAYREAVRLYFRDVLDRGRTELIEEIFHPRCVMHRPGGDVFGWDGVRGVVAHRKESFAQFRTEIEDLFGCGPRVVARLKHHGVGVGIWRSRMGIHRIRGRKLAWSSIAIFRFAKGKIVEEWVSRDELAILLQLGALAPEPRRRPNGGNRAARG